MDYSGTGRESWVALLSDSTRTGGLGPRRASAPHQVRWRLRLGKSVRSAPVFHDGKIYVTCLEEFLHACRQQGWSSLHHRYSGRGNPLEGLRGIGRHAPPVICEGIVCIQAGGLIALDISTGKVVWVAGFGYSLQSAPILTGNSIFLTGSRGIVYALD